MSASNQGYYWQQQRHVQAQGLVATRDTHPGGGGRIAFNLPKPHAFGSSTGMVLGKPSRFVEGLPDAVLPGLQVVEEDLEWA